MGTEIERKFRVASNVWRAQADQGTAIRQFYLAMRDGCSIRIRVLDGSRAILTVKTGSGVSRGEFEYEIPVPDAQELEAARIGNVLEKRRYRVPLGSLTVEIDVYGAALDGLVVAEIELPEVDHVVNLPDWLGAEVSDDPRYLNARLAQAGQAPAD